MEDSKARRISKKHNLLEVPHQASHQPVFTSLSIHCMKPKPRFCATVHGLWHIILYCIEAQGVPIFRTHLTCPLALYHQTLSLESSGETLPLTYSGGMKTDSCLRPYPLMNYSFTLFCL